MKKMHLNQLHAACAKFVFISGPMTGKRKFNYPAFYRVEDNLAQAGFIPLNPARGLEGTSYEGRMDLPWNFYMRVAISMLLNADAVVFLPGWKNSKGAREEERLARTLGLVRVYVSR